MDQDWRALATQRAEYVSERIRGLLSSGLDLLRAELGLDLGIKPEKCPTWLIVSTALIGLVMLVLIAACGRRKRRAAPAPVAASPAEAPVKSGAPPKTAKSEPSEPKKKNKKKTAEKQKAQANGQTVAEAQEIRVGGDKKKAAPAPAPAPPPTPAPAPAPAAAPVPAPALTAQTPADAKIKKNKKKPKVEVKTTQDVSSSTTDGKEPDEGAWETKVSHREKRQQRRKEKGPGESSGSPEAGERAGLKVEQPVATAGGTKRNKESSRVKASKGDAVILTPVTSNWSDVNSVNGGGWTELPVKQTLQSNALNSEKWSAGRKSSGQKNRENSSWKHESEGPIAALDGRMKAEPNLVNLSVLGLNSSGGESGTKPSVEVGKWDKSSVENSEWSSFNGLTSVDPSSDWNAPAEVWGNYEEHRGGDAPALKEAAASKTLAESNDEKDKEDPAGSGKSKRKKKKKRPEEEGSAAERLPEASAPAEKSTAVPPHAPKGQGPRQNTPAHKETDQNWEAPKQVQKKRARRET